MDDWQQDWVKMAEAIANEVEEFCNDVAKKMGEATDAFVEFSDQVAEQIHQAIAPSLDRLDEDLAEWLEPVLQAFIDFEGVVYDAAQPINQTIDPIINEHPVCVGCRNYHGQSYGGNMLVCGMHPYGVADGQEDCPDKDPIDWTFPSQ